MFFCRVFVAFVYFDVFSCCCFWWVLAPNFQMFVSICFIIFLCSFLVADVFLKFSYVRSTCVYCCLQVFVVFMVVCVDFRDGFCEGSGGKRVLGLRFRFVFFIPYLLYSPSIFVYPVFSVIPFHYISNLFQSYMSLYLFTCHILLNCSLYSSLYSSSSDSGSTGFLQ